MTIAKSVLGIVPGLQATAIMGDNLRMAKMSLNPRASQRARTKNMFGTAVRTIAEVGLMKPTAQMINDF